MSVTRVYMSLGDGGSDHERCPIRLKCPDDGWANMRIGDLCIQFSHKIPFAKTFLEQSIDYLKGINNNDLRNEIHVDLDLETGNREAIYNWAEFYITDTEVKIVFSHAKRWANSSLDGKVRSVCETTYRVETNLKFVIKTIVDSIRLAINEWIFFDNGIITPEYATKEEIKWSETERSYYGELIDKIKKLLKAE